jgi:hypothetical protein
LHQAEQAPRRHGGGGHTQENQRHLGDRALGLSGSPRLCAGDRDPSTKDNRYMVSCHRRAERLRVRGKDCVHLTVAEQSISMNSFLPERADAGRIG